MKKLLLTFLTFLGIASAKAQDPNFHIYLCLGQSNMQGKGKIEAKDTTDVPERFKMMATVDFPKMGRVAGKWYTAVPPICRPETGLSPVDYFGRKLVEKLPDSISVGVISVAVDGCSIRMFDEDVCTTYIKGQPDYMTSAAAAYDNNPFRRLVNLAKEAQKEGVIKGILLHQGETDQNDMTWPIYVHRIYTRMLNELGLDANEVPLIAGEMLRAEFGGVCEGAIANVKRLQNVLPNIMVATSDDCPGGDQYHFNSAGYRIIGRRYGLLMYDYLQGYRTDCPYDITSLRAEEENLNMLPATSRKFHIYGTDTEGVEHDITSACTFEIDNPELLSIQGTTLSTAQGTGVTTMKATLGDKSVTINVDIHLNQLTDGTFSPSIYMDGTLKESSLYTSFKSSTNGFGGWIFRNGYDATQTPYLLLDFNSIPSKNSKLFIFDENDFMGIRYVTNINTSKTQVIDLRTLENATATRPVDISHIHLLGFCFGTSPSLYIKRAQLSTDGVTPVETIYETDEVATKQPLFDLTGRRVTTPVKGLYIKGGKVVRF